jgi:hypothetical protein
MKYYPSTPTKEGRKLVKLAECYKDLSEATSSCNEQCLEECSTKWMNENNCCMEAKEYSKFIAEKKTKINEEGEAAGAPAAGYATPGNVTGMGNPASPQNGGTNQGFYDASKSGSGDRFDAVTRKSKRKNNILKRFSQFIGSGKIQ